MFYTLEEWQHFLEQSTKNYRLYLDIWADAFRKANGN